VLLGSYLHNSNACITAFFNFSNEKDIFEVAKSMQPLKQDQVKILANAPRICMELQGQQDP
jgi:hypothetical protein